MNTDRVENPMVAWGRLGTDQPETPEFSQAELDEALLDYISDEWSLQATIKVLLDAFQTERDRERLFAKREPTGEERRALAPSLSAAKIAAAFLRENAAKYSLGDILADVESRLIEEAASEPEPDMPWD